MLSYSTFLTALISKPSSPRRRNADDVRPGWNDGAKTLLAVRQERGLVLNISDRMESANLVLPSRDRCLPPHAPVPPAFPRLALAFLLHATAATFDAFEAISFFAQATGSKIGFFMPGLPEVRLYSRAFGVFGSFVKCGLA